MSHVNHIDGSDLVHQPVLLGKLIDLIRPQLGESYLDLTAGYGGHALEVISLTGQPTKAVLVDRDKQAIDVLSKKFPKAQIIHQDFAGVTDELVKKGQKFDLIVADLGVSSPHLDKASRGFSFNHDGPLDMRMDQSQQLSALDIVNEYSVEQLKALIKDYGEEPKAAQVARLIVAHRPLSTTAQLAEVIKKAYPAWRRTHPATKTFQALRIAVNDELGQLRLALPRLLDLLSDGGRAAIISFHSLEDRLVKQVFNEATDQVYGVQFRLLTKKPIVASEQELVFNPRARSSKLRGVVKIKNKEREATDANSGKKSLPRL